jgi:hypothetical protein
MSSGKSRDPFADVMPPCRGSRRPSDRFMIDPSLLLTESGLAWFINVASDRVVTKSAVVSESFYWALTEGPDDMLLPFVGRRDREIVKLARRRLPVLLERIDKFSYRTTENTTPEVQAVRDAVLRTGRPEADIVADEWTYLVTKSWLIAKRKAFLSRVKRAGANVVEITGRCADEYRERLIRRLIASVIPHDEIPDVLTRSDWSRIGIKWVIYGGAVAGEHAAAGWIGAAAGGLLTGPVIQAIDP